jgi:hypothetical protein
MPELGSEQRLLSESSMAKPTTTRWLNFLLTFFGVICGSRCLPAQNIRWSVDEEKDNIRLFSEASIPSGPIWEQLADVSTELDATLGIRTNGADVQVILFRDHSSYLRYLSPRLPQCRNRKALYYRNGEVSQIYAYQSRSLMVDLRHEMTHVLVHQHLPYAALWLDEGLAEFFEETPSARESTSRISTVRWRARTGRVPSLKGLEAIPKAEAMGEDEYRDSWAWVSFFMSHSERSRTVLKDYVHQIHRGEAPGPMSAVATAEIPGLNDTANSYFKKMSIRVTFDSSR